MDALIDSVLEKIGHKVNMLRKYVDDFIGIVRKDDVNIVLDTLNSIDDQLQFTMEVEVDGKLPFLDLMLHKEEDGSISTEWYSKPYASNRLLNYASKHPKKQLLSTASGFANRVISLTDHKHLPAAVRSIMKILDANNYPKQVIDKVFGRMEHPVQKAQNEEVPKYAKLMYIPGYTELLRWTDEAICGD